VTESSVVENKDICENLAADVLDFNIEADKMIAMLSRHGDPDGELKKKYPLTKEGSKFVKA